MISTLFSLLSSLDLGDFKATYTVMEESAVRSELLAQVIQILIFLKTCSFLMIVNHILTSLIICQALSKFSS